MKNSDVLFAILRKSAPVLKKYAVSDHHRKWIIEIKNQFSKLSPVLRNMLKVMATDIERFSVVNGTKTDMKNALTTENSGPYPVLIDNTSGKQFIIKITTIQVEDIVVFKDQEHRAFVVGVGCLLRAKEHQDRIIEELNAEEKRLAMLSEFH